MSFLKLEKGAERAILDFIKGKRADRPVRIHLRSTGCCDSSLGLCLDEIHPSDILAESEGLTFAMSEELYRTTGEVTLSYDVERSGFVLTSEKPISEWDGFGVCQIEIEAKARD